LTHFLFLYQWDMFQAVDAQSAQQVVPYWQLQTIGLATEFTKEVK
jgi:hypothetical protein